MNSVIRAFIAIEMSPEIQHKLDLVSSQLIGILKDVPIRWARPKNIHLTLKFLGDVSVSNLELLKEMLAVEMAGHSPFEMSVGELGAFPNNRRPRVIWIKVEAPAQLAAVQYGIENQTERLGYPREERPFSPHLTLGRVSRGATSDDIRRISEVLEKHQVGFLGVTRVEAVNIYKSDLRSGGAVYTCLFSAKLIA